MTADREQLRFYVDESALGLGLTLAAARKDTIHPGPKLIPECPVGTLDPDWIPVVAEHELIVIARDKRIRSKPQELELLRESGLRVFWIAGRRDLSTWDWLVRIIRNWERMEEVIEARGAGPWFYSINERSLTQLRV